MKDLYGDFIRFERCLFPHHYHQLCIIIANSAKYKNIISKVPKIEKTIIATRQNILYIKKIWSACFIILQNIYP